MLNKVLTKGILRFFPGTSAGKQSVANNIMATMYATIVPVAKWKTRDLDGICLKAIDYM